jgi:hypothetical protein
MSIRVQELVGVVLIRCCFPHAGLLFPLPGLRQVDDLAAGAAAQRECLVGALEEQQRRYAEVAAERRGLQMVRAAPRLTWAGGSCCCAGGSPPWAAAHPQLPPH